MEDPVLGRDWSKKLKYLAGASTDKSIKHEVLVNLLVRNASYGKHTDPVLGRDRSKKLKYLLGASTDKSIKVM
ncbi:hypothetical protein C5167_045298 [Papaver somniferum]|uniref:Uncharacterized protein n=1 Tax=Papaver somniferum TaxID=3469 RepID=A0A4Y7LAK3_PAPSO|nr:hypothetical protein C5167_045298 [Papaver somniferum]